MAHIYHFFFLAFFFSFSFFVFFVIFFLGLDKETILLIVLCTLVACFMLFAVLVYCFCCEPVDDMEVFHPKVFLLSFPFFSFCTFFIFHFSHSPSLLNFLVLFSFSFFLRFSFSLFLSLALSLSLSLSLSFFFSFPIFSFRVFPFFSVFCFQSFSSFLFSFCFRAS